MLKSSRRASAKSSGKTTAAPALFEPLEERRLMSSYYYVSPNGSDLNPGTSTTKPFRTLSKLNSINFQAGDTICLQSGATFSGRIYFDQNDKGAAATPITVTNWGSGRATISSGTGFGIYGYNTAGFVIKNVNLAGSGSTNTSGGIFFYNDRADGTKLDGITITAVDVKGYKYGIEIGGGINSAGGSNQSGFKNITISYAGVHDNIMGGLFTFGATYNVNQKLYVHHVQAYNNTGVAGYTGISGNGLMISSVYGATVERCVAYNNGAIGNGGAGIWCYDSTKVLFQFNESHHNRTGGPHDGDGFDFDQNTSYSVMQYNYSHDNDGAGYLMSTKYGNSLHKGNVVRYNISQNDCRKLGYGALHIWGKVLNAEWYNNSVYLAPSSNTYSSVRYGVRIVNDSITSYDVNGVHFRNNIVQTTGGLPLVYVMSTQLDSGNDLKFQNNDWYSSGSSWKVNWGSGTYSSLSTWRTYTGQEKYNGANVGTNVNPLFAAPGTGGTIGNPDNLSSLTAYKLQSTSPVKNAGWDLYAKFGIGMGTRDFLGTATPQGGAYDMGACEYI